VRLLSTKDPECGYEEVHKFDSVDIETTIDIKVLSLEPDLARKGRSAGSRPAAKFA
jgi:hypothetical protein